MDEFKYIEYEVADAVATITLARPEKANAQNERMLDELHKCFLVAEYDDDVKVIVLRGQGKHFSAGHDLGGGDGDPDAVSLAEPDGSWHLNKMYRWEARKYLGYSWHWRNIPKPTIGAIQGKAIAGALNLIWPLDLLVVADDVEFSDPVVLMAIGGVEYHGHTWELGARRAKDMLFTQRKLGAEEAVQIGLARGGGGPRPAVGAHPRTGRADRRQQRIRTGPGQASGEPDPRRAGLLHGPPVGVRRPQRGPRQRHQRQRLSHLDATRRDEAEPQEAIAARCR